MEFLTDRFIQLSNDVFWGLAAPSGIYSETSCLDGIYVQIDAARPIGHD